MHRSRSLLSLAAVSAIMASAVWLNAATFAVTRAEWNLSDRELRVEGTGRAGVSVTVSDANTGAFIGRSTVSSEGRWRVRTHLAAAPCRVRADSDGSSLSAAVTNAPASCTSTPASGSHAGRFTAYEGTKTCLTCHQSQAVAMHQSVHYQWQGDATEATGLSSPTAGKMGGINDFCIYPDINWLGKLTNAYGQQVDGGCARCHTGLGARPTPETSATQLENIDCLICHAPGYKRTLALTNGAWRFVPDTAKMTVSILEAAQNVTRPGNAECLRCHATSGGGNNFKRGDLEVGHANPSRELDVHMASRGAGGAGLVCTTCHITTGHRIAGRGIDMRERDSAEIVACSNCHGTQPHDARNLDTHTARVNCTVCHIPRFARQAPTDMVRDWSKPGVLNQATGLYEPDSVMATNVTPTYAFFNGRSRFYEFGAWVPNTDRPILMAGPLGTIQDRGATIQAMKTHQGVQPIEIVGAVGRLLPLKMGIFYQTGSVANAVSAGATEAFNALTSTHQPYSGQYAFATTERHMGLYHQVAPHDSALGCTSCHGGTRMDFAALGYTPLSTRNGRPLCSSCHAPKTATFFNLHQKHVTDKKLDCINCHTFSKG